MSKELNPARWTPTPIDRLASGAKPFVVQSSGYDSSRPWAVTATFRSFRRVVRRYETRKAAACYATYLNKKVRKDGL